MSWESSGSSAALTDADLPRRLREYEAIPILKHAQMDGCAPACFQATPYESPRPQRWLRKRIEVPVPAAIWQSILVTPKLLRAYMKASNRR